MTATATQPPANPFAVARQQVSAILLSEDAKKHIAPYLHHGVSLERVVSTVHQVVAENPELLECTPASLIMAVSKGVNWDLEFGETVHLVPFNVNVAKRGQPDRFEKRAKAIRDYKGDIELVCRSGAARAVDAQCFYENEHFIYHQGTTPYIEHTPIVDTVKRGKMLGAYGWARINVHVLKIAVMSVAEIDKIRQEKSKSWKKGPLPDWYACKTLVHRVTKAIPKNKRLADIISQFDKEEEEIPEGEFEVVVESTAAADTPSQSANGDSASTSVGTQSPAEAATTAAAAAPLGGDDTPDFDAEEPDLNAMTLAQAKATELIGPPGSWNGKAGHLLDSFSTGHLEKLRTWLREKIEEKGEDRDKETMATAISLILEDRAKDQTKLNLEPKSVESPTSTNVKIPPGGKVADALPEKPVAEKKDQKEGLPF